MSRLRKDGQQVDHAVTRVRPPMIRIIAGHPQWRQQRLQLHKDLISAFHSCSLNSIYTRLGGHATQFIQPGPWSYTDRVVYLPVVSQTTRKGPASTGRCRRLPMPELPPPLPSPRSHNYRGYEHPHAQWSGSSHDICTPSLSRKEYWRVSCSKGVTYEAVSHVLNKPASYVCVRERYTAGRLGG